MSHTICVTGASGFVGRAIVKELLNRGHSVRALVRDASKGADVLGRRDDLTMIVGDILDDDSLDALVDGADACIHLVGIIREAPGGQTFERMHLRATESIVNACQRGRVDRYVHMSALGVSAEGVCDYQKTKYRAERAVRSSRLDWTIFRPGLIHGKDSEFVGLVAQWVRGKGGPGVFLPYFSRSVEDTSVLLGPIHQETPVVAPVAVEDVAWCFAEALEREESIGEIYNLAGPDAMTFPQLLIRYRDAVPGAKSDLKPFGIPDVPAAWGARLAKMINLDSALPFDEGMARMGAQDSVAALDKPESHLDWTPTPFDVSYASSL